MQRKLRIFCVEDDSESFDLMVIQLNRMGHAVCGRAGDASDAIAGISKTNPDLVLLDIELQGTLEGLVVGEHLIAKTDVPFVYLTGHDDEQILEQAKATVPDGFLLKPFNEHQLRVAIEMAMRT